MSNWSYGRMPLLQHSRAGHRPRPYELKTVFSVGAGHRPARGMVEHVASPISGFSTNHMAPFHGNDNRVALLPVT